MALLASSITVELELDGKVSKVDGRRMLSRKRNDQIRVLRSLNPGTHKPGCCVCCSAPSFCPLLSSCLFCDDAKYVASKREASKYVFIRENSVEWNDPEVVWMTGSCLGIDPCMYEVQDRTHVLYYDDPMFQEITDRTRCCNECRTCLCGGQGELIQLSSPCCCKMCYRSSFPCPCIPVCCPTNMFPCAMRREIHVQDASQALHEIKTALRNATMYDPLYSVSHEEA